MTPEKQALDEAIEWLYNTFASYPLSQKIEGCPCCVSLEDESRLHRTPLRELTAEDLSRYAFKALTTWGTESDYKHFLPRLLELITEEDSIVRAMGTEVLLGKLHYAKWKMWPEQEREAVSEYLMALWLFVLSMLTEAVTIEEYLCGIGQAEEDLSAYLNAWQKLTKDIAINHLVEFADAQNSLHKGRLSNAFWSGRHEPMAQIVDWLRHIGLL